ncbi:disease resistance-like protein CSA1 [Prunus avium]|uniref:Disease resistance-like protein CSA1 n=1 Tax=Prunus avium TaxID=42229 RepID=A0A6P5REG8_PRUAV|nr:disease resistance-like protein CSA1 [Prunus avium]
MKDCKNLKMLPENICMLKLLETLIISGCTSLNEFSIEMLRNMESLKVLHTDGIPIGELRPGRSSCILSSLPCSLVDLSLRGCNLSNDAFPREFSNLSSLRRLNLGNNPICVLPNCIKDLTRLDELSFAGCKNLKSLLGLPKLGELIVGSCVSLETITYQCSRFRNHSTGLHDNRNLVEWEYDEYKLEPIGSVDAKMINLLGLSNLESMAPIRMCKRSWMSRNFRNPDWSPVQGLYEKDIFSTFFAGNEVPGQFSHKSSKSPISFTVPLLDNHRIQGLKVFAVYTKLYANEFTNRSAKGIPELIITSVSNKSKGRKWIYGPIFYGIPGEGEDMIWLSHWKLGRLVRLDGGDQVVVSVITQPSLQVKEFGIQLVQVSTDSYYPYVRMSNRWFPQYKPGVDLLSPICGPAQSLIRLLDLLGDSDDEDTREEEEQNDLHPIVANNSGGPRGWRVLITATCFVLTLSLITLSQKEARVQKTWMNCLYGNSPVEFLSTFT